MLEKLKSKQNSRLYYFKSNNKNFPSFKIKLILFSILFITFILFYFEIFTQKKLLFNRILQRKKIEKNFFFNKKKEEIKYCKKFGILIYNYSLYKIKIKSSMNIGDYIQSLAALQFLPKNCQPIFIDRDEFELYQGENIKLIMNGWYLLKYKNKKVPDNISPIYLSVHINNANKLDSISINNLKKYQPIGCRDLYTLNSLKKYGIDAYFSSCLTTTLDIDYLANDIERTNEIIFIDYHFGYNTSIDNYIKSLKSYNFSKIIHTKHNFKLNLPLYERFKMAKNLIDKYARAKLVITTRLHGALPCLALHTPCIFVNKHFDKRLNGLYQFLNTVGINSTKQFNINVKFDNNNFVINPTLYLNYSNKLKEDLKKLINL